MTARLLLRHLTVGAVATGALAPATAAASLNVSFANEGHYPARALVASVPEGHPLTAGTVAVTENGSPVKGVSVTPLSTANRGDFGVMLVIDTSQSMAGAPIRQAMLAAQTLAAQRTAQQELGVIEFNRKSSIVLPLTNNPATITSALSRAPQITYGTHIYDATLLAIQQLHQSGVTAATVIVLSDGADVGSTVSRQDVATAAASEHVRVYTVGVNDRDFTPSTLQALARATAGSYTISSVSGLRRVFTAIDSQLTSRYIIRYLSAQRPRRQIRVKFWVDGLPGTWSGRYVSPGVPITGVPRPAGGHGAKASFWASSLAVVLVALASALLLVGGLLAHFVPRAREHTLRSRIRAFTRAEEPRAPEPSRATGRLVELVDRLMGRSSWWARFEQDVEVAAIERSAAEILIIAVGLTLGCATLVTVLTGTPFLGPPVFVIGAVATTGIVRHRADAQRRLFVDQLPGHLEEIGAAMRAGHSVVASIAAMADDAQDPSRREFQRAVADEQLGVPLDTALRPIVRRMKCSDIEQLALVATLNQRTGGNMAAVLDLIAAGVRERSELRRELQALTAQARLSRWIVSALPAAVLAVLAVIRPSYISPLFHTAGGAIALLLATMLVLSGSLAMRMIVAPHE